MSELIVSTESNFVKPHFIEELGEEGLTLHEIAKSLNKEPRHIKEILQRLQLAGFIQGVQTGTFNNINGVPVSTWLCTTEDAKLLVTQSNTREGILYCLFLIQCEKKLLEPKFKIPATYAAALLEAGRLAEECDRKQAIIEHSQKSLTTSQNRNAGLTKENKKLKEELKDWVNPTEIGVALAVSAREANKRLCTAGMQIRKGDTWELTNAGHEVGKYSEFETDAYKGRRIFWDRKAVLKILLTI